MNYSQVIKAIPALAELKKMRLPYAKARDIHRLHKAFEAEYQFFAQEETKLIQELAAKDEKGKPKIVGRQVTFENAEARIRYNERIGELGSMDANVDFREIALTAAEIGNELISAKTIEALEGIITFE